MDCYAVLQVAKDCPSTEIHSQYRRLALNAHPHRRQTDPQKAKDAFRRLGQAWDILREPRLRQLYDELG